MISLGVRIQMYMGMQASPQDFFDWILAFNFWVCGKGCEQLPFFLSTECTRRVVLVCLQTWQRRLCMHVT